MFLRFRLWLLSRRIVRLSRRQARLQRRFSHIGDVLKGLTYRRRFFQAKLGEVKNAITFREWLKAIFRRPEKRRATYHGAETPPVNTPNSTLAGGVKGTPSTFDGDFIKAPKK